MVSFKKWWKDGEVQLTDELYAPVDIAEAAYTAGAKAMQDQSDYWKSRYERERDLYDRQTKTLTRAAAERAVSDRLLDLVKNAIVVLETRGADLASYVLQQRLAEVEAMRKEQG